MGREAAFDKLLAKWAKEWKEANLTPEVRKLISQANFDLYHGPVKDGAVGDPAEGDEEWAAYPGFTTATKQIREALTNLPSELYMDTETDTTLTSEPEPEKCEQCNGQGEKEEEDDDGETNMVRCKNCGGRGGFDPAGDWWKAERSDILHAIVGKELVEYVS